MATFQYVLFIVSLWSWELSAAHFNFAVTIASYINTSKYESIGSKFPSFLGICLSQVIGAFFGIFLTFLSSKYYLPDGDNNKKEIQPKVNPSVCPYFGSKFGKGCDDDGLYLYVFWMDFWSSFIFIFCWILIRKYEFKGNISRLTNLLKPGFIMLVY